MRRIWVTVGIVTFILGTGLGTGTVSALSIPTFSMPSTFQTRIQSTLPTLQRSTTQTPSVPTIPTTTSGQTEFQDQDAPQSPTQNSTATTESVSDAGGGGGSRGGGYSYVPVCGNNLCEIGEPTNCMKDCNPKQAQRLRCEEKMQRVMGQFEQSRACATTQDCVVFVRNQCNESGDSVQSEFTTCGLPIRASAATSLTAAVTEFEHECPQPGAMCIQCEPVRVSCVRGLCTLQ